MPVNIAYLDKVIKQLQERNLDKILTSKIEMSFLDKEIYSKDTLEVWLQNRIDILLNLKNLTDSQIISYKDTAYKGLCKKCKLIADTILSENIWEVHIIPCGELDLLRLYAIQIYKNAFIGADKG